MWFAKAVQDFNNSIAAQGQQGPNLIATIGNAFTSEYKYTEWKRIYSTSITVVWVAYAFFAVPIISSLTKLNITSTKQI